MTCVFYGEANCAISHTCSALRVPEARLIRQHGQGPRQSTSQSLPERAHFNGVAQGRSCPMHRHCVDAHRVNTP